MHLKLNYNYIYYLNANISNICTKLIYYFANCIRNTYLFKTMYFDYYNFKSVKLICKIM